ncbi:unnamed protein product [Prorocentrum cordatum]|uniref:Uncharacterized protein n=1 Tax=Prorocentrum cordatum TaxID=2364126 RepID=A0ABN9VE50_9DINO|nr:unnamed protein product [Polarella glacialis]
MDSRKRRGVCEQDRHQKRAQPLSDKVRGFVAAGGCGQCARAQKTGRSQGPQLQRWHQRVREGRAVASSAGALLSETWEAKLEPTVICCNAGISACEEGEQWQRASAAQQDVGG